MQNVWRLSLNYTKFQAWKIAILKVIHFVPKVALYFSIPAVNRRLGK
jgi:hypothetical protein